MANVEGENPNFDELKMPGEEAAEPIFETEAVGEAEEQLQPVEEIETAETAEAEPARTEETEEKKGAEKPSGNMPLFVAAACAIGIPVIFLALFQFQIIFFSTAVYLIGICFIPIGVWLGRKTNTTFTIFLACTLAALMTACYCLWIVLGRYQFDLKALEAKQRVSMTVPVERPLIAQNKLQS